MSGTPQLVQRSQSAESSLYRKGQGVHACPQLSRKFVARRISEGETGRLKEQLKCQSCGKGYKHVSSLAKHLWEHTPEWNVTSKLLISKHQQVQLLEAASILVSMNEDEVENEAVKSESSEPSEQNEQNEQNESNETNESNSHLNNVSNNVLKEGSNEETSSQGVNENGSSINMNNESLTVKRELLDESTDKLAEIHDCTSESAILSPAREPSVLGAKQIAKPQRRIRRASSSSYGSLTQLDSLIQLASPLERDGAVFPPRRRRYTATRESHLDEDGLQDPEDSSDQLKCVKCDKHSRSNSYNHRVHGECNESNHRYPNSIFDPKEGMGDVFGPMEV